jgi:hypothetical protein
VGMDWTGLDWTGLDWTGLDWTGLDWTGLDWTGLDWAGMDWTGLAWAEGRLMPGSKHKQGAGCTAMAAGIMTLQASSSCCQLLQLPHSLRWCPM